MVKQLLTFAAACAAFVCANAQSYEAEAYKTWDFTNWSDATISYIKNEISNGNTLWSGSDGKFTFKDANNDVTFTAEQVKEIAGITFGKKKGLTVYKKDGGSTLQTGAAMTIAANAGDKVVVEFSNTGNNASRSLALDGNLIADTKTESTTHVQATIIVSDDASSIKIQGWDSSKEEGKKLGGSLNFYSIKLYKQSGGETAISEVEAGATNGACYNISGQRVGENEKGLVIRDGKLTIKK